MPRALMRASNHDANLSIKSLISGYLWGLRLRSKNGFLTKACCAFGAPCESGRARDPSAPAASPPTLRIKTEGGGFAACARQKGGGDARASLGIGDKEV